MLLSIISVQACKDKPGPGPESKWTFRVRFVGCGPDGVHHGDAWLPFAETSPLSAFDKYPEERPELSLA